MDDPTKPPARAADAANRTRDHLANERTFLAWVRTGLSLLGLGFVLARMGLFLRQLAVVGGTHVRLGMHAGQEFLVTGLVFLVLGTAMSGWSGWHFDRSRREIEAGGYQPARRAALILTAVVTVGGLVIAALVLWRTLVLGGL